MKEVLLALAIALVAVIVISALTKKRRVRKEKEEAAKIKAEQDAWNQKLKEQEKKNKAPEPPIFDRPAFGEAHHHEHHIASPHNHKVDEWLDETILDMLKQQGKSKTLDYMIHNGNPGAKDCKERIAEVIKKYNLKWSVQQGKYL